MIRLFSLVLSVAILSACSLSVNKIDLPRPQLDTYELSKVEELMRNESRRVVVFLRTSWCHFCKNMEQTTFRNESIIQLLNDNFYFVTLDGEHREDIVFQGNRYKYEPTGRNTGTHQLAMALGAIDDELSFPTLVVLDSNYKIVFQHNSYMDRQQLKKVLEAAKENVF